VRVIQLDFPVLGQGSQEAARVAVAAKMQLTPEKYATFHEKLLMGRGAANNEKAMTTAKDLGLDMARLEKDLSSPEVAAIIKGNLLLGDSLKISGTPSYVVGDDVLVGAVGLAAIQARIETTRKAKK
jgi:protein-disulfide isomerase